MNLSRLEAKTAQEQYTESPCTIDILVKATTVKLKTWKKSAHYKRQIQVTIGKTYSRTWDFALFTPREQLNLYEIAQGSCSWCRGCRSLTRYVAGHPRVWCTRRVHTRWGVCVRHCEGASCACKTTCNAMTLWCYGFFVA